jgi:hypothetical protein
MMGEAAAFMSGTIPWPARADPVEEFEVFAKAVPMLLVTPDSSAAGTFRLTPLMCMVGTLALPPCIAVEDVSIAPVIGSKPWLDSAPPNTD